MKISNIDVDAALANVRHQLQADTTVAPSMRTAIELLIVLVQILSGRINVAGQGVLICKCVYGNYFRKRCRECGHNRGIHYSIDEKGRL